MLEKVKIGWKGSGIVISVIVPVYNTESFLEECIQSIVNQTYRELEIIIINDGSTDRSANICRKWEQLDQRIIYIEKENEGQGIARNMGIQLASGEYIIFVDSDDSIDLDLVDKVYTCIYKSKADICVYSHRYIGRHSQEWSLEGKSKNAINIKDNKELLGLMLPILCNKMFVSGLIKKSGVLMGNYMCEDMVFNAQLFVKANKICFFDIPLYNYRYAREGNFSTNYQKYNEAERSINELNKVFQENGNFEIYWIQLYELSMHILKNILERVKNKEEWNLLPEVEKGYSELVNLYKKCLAKWFSCCLSIELQEKNYLLIGSYNLRVIIHSLLLDESLLKEDYGFSSMISLTSDYAGQEISVEKSQFKNSYRKRSVEQDIEKRFYQKGDFQGIDYIIIDLLDEVSNLIKIKDGCYITESEFLQELGLQEVQNCKRVLFFDKERRKLFIKHARLFADKVTHINIPLIVIKNFLCEKHSIYYDNSTTYENIDEIKKINTELEWYYQQLLSYLPDAIVVDSSEFKELNFTHEKFPFGCKPVYYNAGYYQRMAVQLSRCVYSASHGNEKNNIVKGETVI